MSPRAAAVKDEDMSGAAYGTIPLMNKLVRGNGFSAWHVVAGLTFLNLINYADRYVFGAVGPSIIRDLNLTDGQFGALGSAFLWGFLLFTPFVGRLVKLAPRLVILSVSVLGWSLALAGTGIFRAFFVILGLRFLFGAFQSVFTSAAPPAAKDAVEHKWTARALSIFFAAIPLGTALGFVGGSLAQKTVGWQMGLLAMGIVGSAAAFLLFALPNRRKKVALKSSWIKDLRATYVSPTFIWIALGYAAQTFALGAFAFWAPTYIERVFDTPAQTGSLMFGVLIVATGIGGSMVGGWLTDRWGHGQAIRAAIWVSLWATLIATPFVIFAFVTSFEWLFYLSMAVAQTALFATFSPINLAIMGSVPHASSTTAEGSAIFIGRLLGDAISIWLVGVLSDVLNDMRPAMLVLPLALAINAALWLKAARIQHRQKI